MTKEEKEIALHCLRTMIDEEVCEECDIYEKTGTDHCEADVIRMVIKELEKSSSSEKPNKSEIPSSSDNNLSSELEENSKKLENASYIIDWNNCHASEQLDSIATAGFKHYFKEKTENT